MCIKCINLGSSPNVNGSPKLATILANPSLKNCWLYIDGDIEDALDPILVRLIWDCLGSIDVAVRILTLGLLFVGLGWERLEWGTLEGMQVSSVRLIFVINL